MKRVFEWHGSKYYLLGTRRDDGENYWLKEASFDCNWYWGIGYVNTFTNRKAPWMSKDITLHTHFDHLLDSDRSQIAKGMWYEAFKSIFRETPLTDKEIWTVLELMKSLYTARKYSDMLHCGGSYYTSNPASEVIKNDAEYERINKVVIPALLEKLYRILDGTARKEEEEAKRNGKQT